MSLTAKDVAEILRLLEDSSFDELSLEMDGMKLELRRGGAADAAPSVPSPAARGKRDRTPPPSPSSEGKQDREAAKASPPRAAPPTDPDVVDTPSPLLGVFYRAPKPGEPPFVEVGSKVEEDTIIGIIEVMKLMNTVRAGVRGEVVDIPAQNGALVEFEETLLRVRKAGLAMPIRRILVANRGEIAVRIIRTCRRLGIETVLAASKADLDSLGAKLADRTLCIGPAPSALSYLMAPTIVQAALGAGCDAIHPGYGFLSENPVLARLCEAEGVIFIGPTSTQIEQIGDKLRARAEAEAAGVPTAPGGSVRTPEEAMALGAEIGAPLLVKAVGGGGGRGMKRVDRLEDLAQAMDMASAEAGAAFGDERVYLERFVARGRHVEVQVLGDGERLIHLGERDCSVQRRYQKLIEETPAPGLSETFRDRILQAAVRFAARLAYRGAGTVEFLVDLERDEFYFLEMNARIQVEHPVTEAVSGVDLVAEQIAIAEGQPLRLLQSDVRLQGCAIECRINAEDPARDFQPSPGVVLRADWPSGEGVRVDTHIVAGARVPPFYDSLLAKIIAHGPDRPTALGRLRRAIDATRLEGVAANLAFHAAVLADPEFADGGVDTGYLPRFLARTAALVEA